MWHFILSCLRMVFARKIGAHTKRFETVSRLRIRIRRVRHSWDNYSSCVYICTRYAPPTNRHHREQQNNKPLPHHLSLLVCVLFVSARRVHKICTLDNRYTYSWATLRLCSRRPARHAKNTGIPPSRVPRQPLQRQRHGENRALLHCALCTTGRRHAAIPKTNAHECGLQFGPDIIYGVQLVYQCVFNS